MGDERETQVGSIGELAAPGRPVAVVGEAGLGTTTMLQRAAARLGGTVARGGGLRSLRTVPYLLLNRALGEDVGARPDELPALARDRVGAGVLLLDDLQWADPASLVRLSELAGVVTLLAGIRAGDEGAPTARAAVAGAGGTLVRLAPLVDDEVRSLVLDRRPDLGEEAVAKIVAASGGNPLVAEQLTVVGGVSTSLAEALTWCVDQLDDEGQAALALLSGRPEGVPIAAIGGAADSLLTADLVTTDAGFLRLRHQLVGETAFGRLPDDARRAVHRRLADLADGDGARAHHLLEAGDAAAAGPLARQAAAALPPGRRASLLELASQAAEGDDRVRLLVEAADDALEGEAVAHGRALAEAALVEQPDSPTVAALVAVARAQDGDPAAALAAAGAVTDDAPAEARARAAAAVAYSLAWPLWQPVEAQAAVAEAERLAHGAPGVRGSRGVVRLVAGDPRWREDRAALGRTTQWWGDLLDGRPVAGDPNGSGLAAVVVTAHLRADCDADAALLPPLLDRLSRPIDRQVAAAHLAIALADCGRTAAAADVAGTALRDDPAPAGRTLLLWALIEAELAGGRLVRALAAAEQIDRSVAAPAASLAHLAAAWAVAVSPTEVDLPPAPPAPPWPGLAAVACEMEALALRGRSATDAAAAFDDAAERWAPSHRRGELRCRWAAADALCATDGEAAVDRLRALEPEVAELGQRPLVARIRASLRSVGVRPRPHRGAGRGPLSARELEVLELVRLGFTTGEAAQSLGVAPSTVETQVESAMRKLGARTRLQAAAAVAGLS